ncbi:shikimate dehydrogenase family protein [Candidatus Spyradosoma sp. SGI.093]|uniref:shikimate dehydrogenase family protein n=1 Tax=Candidatus Spyradosoma sp. SGI.093 TaxID=3420583 RepID=UPI003D05E740
MNAAEKVFTLADLRAWTRAEPSFAVLGKPIAHSLSPKMHDAALDAAARERSAPELAARRYFRFEIAPEELGEALPLFFAKNFLGLNLTIPHKVAALPLLKKISPEAEIIGAANTLARDDALSGWRGENTDGRGFARAAEMSLGVKLAGTRVVLLGAGGAARAIAATALAQGCASLTIVNRSRDRAEALARALSGNSGEATFQSLYENPYKEISLKRIPTSDKNVASPKSGFPKISVLSPDEIRDFRGEGKTLVVNATPLGLKPGDPSPFPLKLFRDGFAAYDTTYGAHVPALVAAARERGVPAADGRAMLAWQGALAFELWNGVPAADAFPVMFAAIS